MAKTDPYFQFPIAILRDQNDTKKLVNDMISYAMWNYGLSLHRDTPDSSVIEAIADQYIAAHPDTAGFDRNNFEHCILLAAVKRLGIGANRRSVRVFRPFVPRRRVFVPADGWRDERRELTG